jgi:hypothetical protein
VATEQALHAYIFFGNALNLLLHGMPAEWPEDPASLRALYAAVEPLTPKDIAAGLDALPEDQRALLARAARRCLDRLGTGFETLMGVSQEEAAATLPLLHFPPGPSTL